MHAAGVIKELNSRGFYARHYGIGGYKMQAEGFEALFPFKRFSVMGFLEVLKHIKFFWQVEKAIKKEFLTNKPDLVVLVDYPGMNMRIAKMADSLEIPVLYYICPQFWAWKHRRVFQLEKYTTHVATIFPFEKEILDMHSIRNNYVGHPIAEEIKLEVSKEEFSGTFGLDMKKKWLAFFPGSRNMEIKKMLPVYLKAAKMFNPREFCFLFSKTSTVSTSLYENLIKESGITNYKIIDGYNYELMKYAYFLVVTSGTATLEAAYLGTPFIICYKISKISFAIGKRLVKIKRIGLPNIVLEKDLIPELIQDEANPSNIYGQIRTFLDEPSKYAYIQDELSRIKQMLGTKSASREVANIIVRLIKENTYK